MKISPTEAVIEQRDRHIFLAQELLKAECAMKSISLNLSSLRLQITESLRRKH